MIQDLRDVILNPAMLSLFNNTSVVNKLEGKKAQMQITEIGGSGINKEEMDGDLTRLEPTKIEDFKERMVTWFMLKEGGFIPYMQAMAGYDENCALQFVNGWNDRRVTIYGILFQVNEEFISMATSLSLKGKKWKKFTKMTDMASLNCFFTDDE